MNSEQAVAWVIERLENSGVGYILVGAFSSNLYGVPRSTRDADIVVDFGSVRIVDFCRSLGDDFFLDRQMMVEGFTGSVRNIVHFKPTNFDIEFSVTMMILIISSDLRDVDDSKFPNSNARPGYLLRKMSLSRSYVGPDVKILMTLLT